MADTVAGAVSDAAGEAVPAGVAEQALPEPYVPGSGDKLPAELWLVLGGYAGIACLSAGGLALVAAAVLVYWDGDLGGAIAVAVFGLCLWCLLGGLLGLEALKADIGFSRLLRRPSDARTAMVMASERGGRTLILDSTPPRRHRPRVPAPVEGSPRVVDEGRHAGAR